MLFKGGALPLRLLSVLAGVVAVLAVWAAPAFAEFESPIGKQTGQGKVMSVVLEGGGATLECASAEGAWTILTDIGGKESTKGKVLQFDTTQWNGCKAKSKEIKEVSPKVKACVLDFRQEAGQSKAKSSVVRECTVEVTVLFLTCTIHLQAEKASEQINSGLESNVLANQQANLLINVEDRGITMTPTGTCPGIAATKEGKQNETVTAKGVRPAQGVSVNHMQIKTTGIAKWSEILVYKVMVGAWIPDLPVENVSVGNASWLTVFNGCIKPGGYVAPESCEVELRFSESGLNVFRALLEFAPAPNVTIESN